MYPQFLLANFSSDVVSGSVPLTVNFTNGTTGWPDENAPIISHAWDFGDGNTSTENNPTHTYLVPGSYTVTLIESRNFVQDTVTKISYIQASSTVGVDFVGTPLFGYTSLTVSFTDLTYPLASSWYWSFGDGSHSTEQNPVHNYRHPGEYTVSLRIPSSLEYLSETKVHYILVTDTATNDVAPAPDKKAYLWGPGMVKKRGVGIEIKFVAQY